MGKGGVPGLVFTPAAEDMNGWNKDTPCGIKPGDDKESMDSRDVRSRYQGILKSQCPLPRDLRRLHLSDGV